LNIGKKKFPLLSAYSIIESLKQIEGLTEETGIFILRAMKEK
jgi:hypothetical protein